MDLVQACTLRVRVVEAKVDMVMETTVGVEVNNRGNGDNRALHLKTIPGLQTIHNQERIKAGVGAVMTREVATEEEEEEEEAVAAEVIGEIGFRFMA
jgi:hypothetical protein